MLSCECLWVILLNWAFLLNYLSKVGQTADAKTLSSATKARNFHELPYANICTFQKVLKKERENGENIFNVKKSG